MNIDALIHAYKKELAGYQSRGLHERAKLVEAELRRLGHSLGDTPREDVLAESASTSPIPPEVPQSASEPVKERPAPKRPTTRKKS
jgi:hypothetical protein